MTSIRSGLLRLEPVEGAGWSIEDHEAAAFWIKDPAPSQPLRLPELLGRNREVEIAARTVRQGSPLEFYAPCGYGRTTLLRHLAVHLPTVVGFPAVYLDTHGRPPEDLPQRVVRELVDTQLPTRASPGEAQRLLERITPLVLLDDVEWDAEQARHALRDLASCLVVLASDRPHLREQGRSHPLGGLTAQTAPELIRSDIGRELTRSEWLAASRLSDIVDGRPASLRQAGAIVRRGKLDLEELAERVSRDSSALQRLGTGGLTVGQRRTLAALAVVGGAVLPANVLAVVSGVAQTSEALRELRDLAIVDEQETGFDLPRCAGEARKASLLGYLDLTAAVRELAEVLEHFDPGDVERADVLAVLEAATALLGIVAERRDWQGVVQLVRVLEPLLTVAGRWETSVQVLSVAVRAASHIGDVVAEADFLHQSGSLAFGLGDAETARSQLARALELRRASANWVGAEITRRNLSRLTAVPKAARPRDPSGDESWIAKLWKRRDVKAGLAICIGLFSALGVVAAVAGGEEPGSAFTVNTSPAQTSPAPTPTTPTPTTPTVTPTTPPPSPTTTTPTVTLLAPVVTVDADELRGHVGTGDVGTLRFTVKNPNALPLPLEPISVTGSPAFAVRSDCPQVLAASESCTGQVTLSPDEIGTFTGDLQVSDKEGHRVDSPLTGIGYVQLTINRTYDSEPAPANLSVTATLGGRTIRCPDDCTVTVTDPAERAVTLTAEVDCSECTGSDGGPRFEAWSLPACPSTADCVIDVVRDSEITARFRFEVG